jgi:hypothetical protein
MTDKARRSIVHDFARHLAQNDKVACEAAGTEMDGEWSGEASTALADHLGCSVRDLTEDDIAWAEEAYAAEAQKD